MWRLDPSELPSTKKLSLSGTAHHDSTTLPPTRSSRGVPTVHLNSAAGIGFDTSGNSISGTSEVKDTDPKNADSSPGSISPVTLEGESDEPGNVFRNELDHYDDSEPGQYLSGGAEGRYTKVNSNFTVPSSNGDVEGVRASLILGAGDPYLAKAKSDGETLAALAGGATGNNLPAAALQFYHIIPTFYSWIDFAYMADGTKVVTVWDASVYPLHGLYVGGQWRDKNTFREGIEWDEQGPISEHTAFITFGNEAAHHPPSTPFDAGGNFLYRDNFGLQPGFRTGFGDHPVMEYRKPGGTLDGNEGAFGNPMYPNFS